MITELSRKFKNYIFPANEVWRYDYPCIGSPRLGELTSSKYSDILMYSMSKLIKREIAVIVPDQETVGFYYNYLSRYGIEDYVIKYYLSLDELSRDMLKCPGYAGFIVDLRIILKADPCNKEFFYYLLEHFPFIRISYNADKKTIQGTIQGKDLMDKALFDYFFEHLHAPGKKREQKKKQERNIVLIVNNEESKVLYESFLEGYKDISFHHHSSAEAFLNRTLKEDRYCGFIFDSKTMQESKPGEKDFFNELINNFPVMQVSHSNDKKTIRGNIKTKNYWNKKLFDHFIELCRQFLPRGIRMKKRKNLFLNVYLDASKEEPGKELVEANAMDLSEEGVFIVSTHHALEGDTFYVVVKELSDQEPIECKVKWVLPWGASVSHLPGFGAEFTHIKPKQKKEIQELLK